MSNILVISDLHLREYLAYADYITDRREGEKKDILNKIVTEAEDCDFVVLLGDNFDHKNNTAEVIREFVEFIEKFGDKQIYILSGNHEKKGNGSTAIDFMREVNKKNWHIITEIETDVVMGPLQVDFLPYMLKSELGVTTDEEASKEIIDRLDKGNILFHHHMVEGYTTAIPTELIKEPLLPKEVIDNYTLVIGGHIHKAETTDNVVVTGNIFNTQINDIGKYIWKINVEDLSIKQILLPGRKIYGLIDPKEEDLTKLDKSSIVKVIITDKKRDLDNLRILLSSFDTYLLIEKYPNHRTKTHFEEGALDLNIDNLLKIYSEEKKVDLSNLIKGWELIK